MKKLLTTLCLIIFTAMPVFSASLKMEVATLKDFSTSRPNEKAVLAVSGNYKLSKEKYIPDGTVIKGDIIHVEEPKRGKRDGYAFMKITAFQIPGQTEFAVNNPNAIVKLSKYKPIDVVDKTLDLGASAAGFFVKNISYPINFARGVITADEGENRLKSGAKLTYEKSFFSYASKGKALDIPKGEKLILTINYKKSEDNSSDIKKPKKIQKLEKKKNLEE